MILCPSGTTLRNLNLVRIVSYLILIPNDDKCYPFTIDSDCLDLDLVSEADRVPKPNPNFDHRSVWIRLGSKYYAVGNLATTRYNNYLSIKPLKSDSIVPEGVTSTL